MSDKKIESSKLEVNRRSFLGSIAAVGAASFLPSFLPFLFASCEDEKLYVGTGKAPFKVWEEMLEAVKTSPDYLPGRMQRLVESKDLQAMFNFIRDEIYLIPSSDKSNTGTGRIMKWGINGMLRCGMATPRGKAELLNNMFQKVGIESKVVYERTTFKNEEVPALFFRPYERAFSPEISKKQFQIWKEELKITEVDSSEKIKDCVPEANKLTSKILENLEINSKKIQKFNYMWKNNETPTVEFIIDGVTKYAHLFDKKVPFGELRDAKNTIKSKPVEEIGDLISLSLSYRNSISPKEEFELVKGEWNSSELIGKQVVIEFLTGLSFEEQLITKIGNVGTFTPTLLLQGVDDSKDYALDHSFFGDAITLDGKRIGVDEKGNATVDGNLIINKNNQDLQKKVTDLQLKATAIGYPNVKLEVQANNSQGEIIEGLSPKDFRFQLDDEPVPVLMKNNMQTPEILVLSDSSGSMPSAYLGENMLNFNESLRNNIIEKYPNAQIKFWKTTSSLFTWLLKASETSCDLIIFATDGDNYDQIDQKNSVIYKSGAPAIILNVGNVTGERQLNTFNEMAEITNGVVLDAEDQELVLGKITEYINAMKIPPYIFSLTSTIGKGKEHHIKISIDNERLQAKDKFMFSKGSEFSNSGIVGLYLTIKVGNKKIKRVLAGWDPTINKFDSTISYSEKIRELLLGRAILSVEGEGPTLAASVVDVLKTLLSNRKWGEAFLNDDIKKATEEINKGTLQYSSKFISMMSPPQNQVTKESLTFPRGYRMSIIKLLAGMDKSSEISFDYLPTSNYLTLSENKKTAFETNLRITSQFAIREKVFYENSTFSFLEGKQLINNEYAESIDWLNQKIEKKSTDYYYWKLALKNYYNYMIFDENATSKAFWEINKKTGEIYGILPDGTGGGKERILMQLKEIENVVTMGGLFGAATGLPGAWVGGLGMHIIRLYAHASIAILVMDASGLDEMLTKEIVALMCNASKQINFATTGVPGEVMGIIDTLATLIVGDKNNPMGCS
jgi:hypothetical protein